jgi:hypothetical protein
MVTVAMALMLAPAAGAVLSKNASGHAVSLMLRPGALAQHTSTTPAKGGGVLLSHGGPVLSSEAPYLIYWTGAGDAVARSSVTLLNDYLTDVSKDSVGGSMTNVYSVLAQYRASYAQTFSQAQAVADKDPYPPASGCSLAPGMTSCVSDASIQAEIAKLIDAGTLPAPSAPGSGTTPIFFVVTPVDVNVCTSTNSCVNNSFCAYHDFFVHKGNDVLYASVPFSVFANGNAKGCQTDQYSIYESPAGTYHGDEAYNIADDLSHELSETITDPMINAWYSSKGLEVGDLCEAYGPKADINKGLSPLAYAPAFGTASAGTLYDQVINGDQYYNQTEFSNSADGCRAGLSAL